MNANRMRRLLFVTYHYPPCGCSAMFRGEGFVRHLRSSGWETSVLAVRRCRYSISSAIRVEGERGVWRAPELSLLALGARLRRVARSWRSPQVIANGPAGGGRRDSGPPMPAWLSQVLRLPDPANGWYPFAVSAGLSLLLIRPPDAILSSSPPGTAHLIAATLARISRKPWVADFHDPLAGEWGDQEGRSLGERTVARLERMVLARANAVVVVTQGHRRDLVRRYPAHASKVQVIPNGFDGSTIAEALRNRAHHEGQIVISHIGEFYHDIRRPDQFLEALGKLTSETRVDPTRIRVRFVGGGGWCQTPEFQALLDRTRTRDMVEVTPRLPYLESLRHLADANILLLLQPSPLADTAIPSKAYEYLAAGTPTLTIAAKDSATWDLMSRYENGALVEPDTESIASALGPLLTHAGEVELPTIPPEPAMEFERERLTEKLAEILHSVTRR